MFVSTGGFKILASLRSGQILHLRFTLLMELDPATGVSLNHFAINSPPGDDPDDSQEVVATRFSELHDMRLQDRCSQILDFMIVKFLCGVTIPSSGAFGPFPQSFQSFKCFDDFHDSPPKENVAIAGLDSNRQERTKLTDLLKGLHQQIDSGQILKTDNPHKRFRGPVTTICFSVNKSAALSAVKNGRVQVFANREMDPDVP
jgi:hypothetical protein